MSWNVKAMTKNINNKQLFGRQKGEDNNTCTESSLELDARFWGHTSWNFREGFISQQAQKKGSHLEQIIMALS